MFSTEPVFSTPSYKFGRRKLWEYQYAFVMTELVKYAQDMVTRICLQGFLHCCCLQSWNIKIWINTLNVLMKIPKTCQFSCYRILPFFLGLQKISGLGQVTVKVATLFIKAVDKLCIKKGSGQRWYCLSISGSFRTFTQHPSLDCTMRRCLPWRIQICIRKKTK